MDRSDGIVRYVNLKTPFRARARFNNGPEGQRLSRAFRRRLAERGVPFSQCPGGSDDTIIFCVLTLGDALAVDDGRDPEWYLPSLLGAFPELRKDLRGLKQRIQDLDRRLGHRKAS